MAVSDAFNVVGDTGDPRGPDYTVHQNRRGIVVLRPRYWTRFGETDEESLANGDRRSAEWEMAERQRLGDHDFEVQQGERWDAPVGEPYLRTFAEHVHRTGPWEFKGWYVADAPSIWPSLTIRCGVDGGLQRPALIVAQYDPKHGVFWVQREFRPLTPRGEPISFLCHEFVAVCRYLLGLATLADLEREGRATTEQRWSTAAALDWIATEKRDPFYGWPMPWIEPGTRDLRFAWRMAKHEARARSQLAPTRDLASIRKVYRQQGIILGVGDEQWDHRELVLDFLLREGPHAGVPRFLVDSSCKTLLGGMSGGLVTAAPGRRKPYVEDRYYEDAFDAMCNAMCSAFPLEHADRLAALEAAQRRERDAAAAKGPQPLHGGRYRPPVPAAGLTWGGLRGSFEETSDALYCH